MTQNFSHDSYTVTLQDSLLQDYYNHQNEVHQLIEEEIQNIFHHLAVTVPQELRECLEDENDIKARLHDTLNRSYQYICKRSLEVNNALQEKQHTDTVHKRTVIDGGDTAYSIVKYACKDNAYKPKTVTDIKLSINILDAELLQPIFHHQATFEHVIKDIISHYYMERIDAEIHREKEKRNTKEDTTLTDGTLFFKKIAKIIDTAENENGSNKDDNEISPALITRIAAFYTQADKNSEYKPVIRENIKRVADIEKIRDKGFNMAINCLTAALKKAQLDYYYIENLKNSREVLIREYEDTDAAQLPDEQYQIRLRYFDTAQLNEECKAYEVMIRSFETEIDHLWDVVQTQYDKLKSVTHISDFTSLAKLYKKYIQKNYKTPYGNPIYEDITKIWDEISFVSPAETEVEKANRSFILEKNKMRKKLTIIREKIKKMYQYQYPIERHIIEERLEFLETEFNHFDHLINPFHLRPGLVLDVDMTSIKRKKTTITRMLTVIDNFLHNITKHTTDNNIGTANSNTASTHAAKTLKYGINIPNMDKNSREYAQLLDLINRTSFTESDKEEQ